MNRLLLIVVTGISLAWSAQADLNVQVGTAYPEIVEQWGHPTRRVETSSGTLLFYGRTLLVVTNGVIDFISVAGGTAQEVGESVSAPADAPPSGGPRASQPEDDPDAVLDREARRQEERRHQRLATRIKRVAMTQGYVVLRGDFLRFTPTPNSADMLGIKDAKGRAGPTLGNATASLMPMLGIDVQTFVLGP